MKTYKAIALLDAIKEKDAQKEKANREKYGAATICLECGKNTFVGSHPFWHIYRRDLCENCVGDYIDLLRAIGAYDKF